jgi:ATP dependent DNA ligase domain
MSTRRVYRRVVDACGKLACETALIDGEMVVQDEHGITDFHALRSAIYTAPHRLVLFAFDLLHLDGQDLWGQPLMERRVLLRRLIQQDPRSPIQFSDHLEGDGVRFFTAAAELGLEGIVSRGQRAGIAAAPRAMARDQEHGRERVRPARYRSRLRRRALGAAAVSPAARPELSCGFGLPTLPRRER